MYARAVSVPMEQKFYVVVSHHGFYCILVHVHYFRWFSSSFREASAAEVVGNGVTFFEGFGEEIPLPVRFSNDSS